MVVQKAEADLENTSCKKTFLNHSLLNSGVQQDPLAHHEEQINANVANVTDGFDTIDGRHLMEIDHFDNGVRTTNSLFITIQHHTISSFSISKVTGSTYSPFICFWMLY